MATATTGVTIRGRSIPVDIGRELESFDWNKKSIRGDKLLACSPFRKDGNERHPSFAVRLDTGVWIDSGSDNDEWRQGSFVRLLAALRQEDEADTEEYLLTLYDANYADADSLELTMNLDGDEAYHEIILPSPLLVSYRFRHPYLAGRGIDEPTQRLFRIGYDREHKAITIPWFNRSGALINIKFRSVKEKKFWYHKGGDKISNHVFGLDLIVTRQFKRVFVVEAEIDCMYLWAHGIPAVALGGSSLSTAQRESLLRAGIREIIIATDNDPAGEQAGKRIASALSGWIDLYKLVLPNGCKDVNELPPLELSTITDRINPFPYSFV